MCSGWPAFRNRRSILRMHHSQMPETPKRRSRSLIPFDHDRDGFFKPWARGRFTPTRPAAAVVEAVSLPRQT